MKKISPIPVYHLHERAAKNFQLFDFVSPEDISHLNQAHRDDNYLFMIQRSGSSTAMIDFKEVTIAGGEIFCILPGQVHYGISSVEASAWVLALDPSCVKEDFRGVLSDFSIRNEPVVLQPLRSELLHKSMELLSIMEQRLDNADESLASMLQVCITLFVDASRISRKNTDSSSLRPLMITRQFRSLLLLKFREMKSPSDYAALLNISSSYLNEAIKDTTGFPVSYWIHQEIVLEAKRMLFHTDNTVKQIAYSLGYSDPTYFIRVFTKNAGLPPLQFRSNSRK